MRALAPALLMSFLVAGPTTAFGQFPCGACQSPAVSSPPAAYYYPVQYAAPAYVYAVPAYYVPTMYYVPVAAPAEPPVTDDFLGEFSSSRSMSSGTATGRVRVYSRTVNSAGRVASTAQFARPVIATDHDSMVLNGFHLIKDDWTTLSVDPAGEAARTRRLRDAASAAIANAIDTHQGSGALGLRSFAPARPNDGAKQIADLKKSVDAMVAAKKKRQVEESKQAANVNKSVDKMLGAEKKRQDDRAKQFEGLKKATEKLR